MVLDYNTLLNKVYYSMKINALYQNSIFDCLLFCTSQLDFTMGSESLIVALLI